MPVYASEKPEAAAKEVGIPKMHWSLSRWTCIDSLSINTFPFSLVSAFGTCCLDKVDEQMEPQGIDNMQDWDDSLDASLQQVINILHLNPDSCARHCAGLPGPWFMPTFTCQGQCNHLAEFVPLRIRVRAFFERWPGALKARFNVPHAATCDCL